MQDHTDSSSQEPELKYLVADLREAYQDGLDIYANRIQRLVFGEDVQTADELRRSFHTGYKELGKAYTTYYKQAGKHFARGDGMYAGTPLFNSKANNPQCTFKLSLHSSFIS